ncbi:MAG: cell division protein ZapA [Terrimonas sp.]|nr:cell division protein ZapA [Terrimonas sp.]
MSDQLIPISIVIGDRSYRIKIHPKDEEVVRKSVKTINDKILEFRTQFAGKDMQDYISMVLVWFATEKKDIVGNGSEKETLTLQLDQLEKMLDQALEK